MLNYTRILSHTNGQAFDLELEMPKISHPLKLESQLFMMRLLNVVAQLLQNQIPWIASCVT
jgi:hypothetical protein